MKRVIVYAGPCYGAVHQVLTEQGRALLVQPPDLSKPIWVSVCDTEPAQ